MKTIEEINEHIKLLEKSILQVKLDLFLVITTLVSTALATGFCFFGIIFFPVVAVAASVYLTYLLLMLYILVNEVRNATRDIPLLLGKLRRANAELEAENFAKKTVLAHKQFFVKWKTRAS